MVCLNYEMLSINVTYGLKCFIAQCMAANPWSVVDLFLSPLVKDLEAYAIGNCTPLCSCESTASHACLLASVVMQNSLLKSGYCNNVGFNNAFLRY